VSSATGPVGPLRISVQMTPLRGAGTTILVVDDDALITLNTADILSEYGHTAIEAYSGPEALSLMEAHPHIDAIVTDYAMPGMTGIELAEAARRLKPGLPVLLTTGYAELPDDLAQTFARLEKPYREDQLIACLTELLAPAVE
jgi:CheY-like chemotaxis protein